LLFVPFIIALSSLATSCDKENMLYGTWRLQAVLMNGDTLNDTLQFNVIPKYTIYEFFYEHTFTVKTYISGQSVTSPEGFYNITNNSLHMRYTLLYRRYDIPAKIKKLTRRELNLEYEYEGNSYFLKFYRN
jgi:hypothetical protein